ncbi:SDR family NAD(P)-dependent oxidoreductase [Cecembia calidifontis]|uniref:NAD(P)-dependent dehydrogenase (Short-subunit alcohol dehydrogenase family) n=1 Tax=Cecembia calidifontis TaxID=1187080 RepID=A0A4Q7PAG8_9BACT|nr:SDR family NAD(P)-dependent oxidoreductase [Cecembia calidifontis]RZS97175.1 NAD(P)-dependent dehydrogenase (short-subunit alcohol dehydrogenase family) [Cecembia calidifontis]
MKLAITGPTSGIGAVTFHQLTPICKEVFFLARNKDKAQEEITKLPAHEQSKVRFIYTDFADLDSVNKAALEIQEMTGHLDILINNAGGIFQEKVSTKDGFELTLSANHLGHFLLTNKLMPILLKARNPKVINVSSEAHKAAKVNFEDLNYTHNTYSAFTAYANVKLFNILFTKSLVEKFGKNGLRSYALHPGVVKTNFGNEAGGIFKLFWWMAKPFMIDAQEGAKTSIFLAKSQLPESQNGFYFKNSRPGSPSKTALSKAMREKLWTKSEALLEKYL